MHKSNSRGASLLKTPDSRLICAQVAAEGWEAPGVAVVYANNDPTYAGHFKNAQFQIAAGVPLVLGEPDHYNSFRIGLFGLDKLMHVDKTIRNFEVGLDAVMAAKGM